MSKFSDSYFCYFIKFKIDTYITTRNLYENSEMRDVIVLRYPMRCYTIHISHIIFADDLLIFLQNDLTSVRNLATILNDFDIVSGLQLNHAKSKVYMSPCIEDKNVIAHTLGVSEGNLLVIYWVSHSYPLAFTKSTISLSCKK